MKKIVILIALFCLLAVTVYADTTFVGSGGSTATTVTVANEATDTTCFPTFVTAATGDLGPKTNTSLTFNSNTGAFGATTLLAGSAIFAGGTNTFSLTNGTASMSVAAGKTVNFSGTFTDGGYCTFTSSGNVIGCDAAGGAHDALTLGATATSILGLTTQELGFDTQTANYVLAGPTTGDPAAPTFRALVAADLPTNTKAIEELTFADKSIIQLTGAGAAAVLTCSAANQLIGVNAANDALECKSTINVTLDDSAAQIVDATDATKKIQIEAGSITTGNTRTLTMADGNVTLQAGTLIARDTTDTLTNKTYDVAGTGNVFGAYGYIVLTHPHLCAAGAPMQTTTTANTYGQCKFGNATDKATNYAEYYLVVPPDVDTATDLTATFKIKLGGADTGDHEYEISFDSVADSAAYAGTLGDPISLAFTADASGADGDVETAGETTLTGWRSAMTAGQLFVVRVARDGDHANDGSTVDSYSGPLVIKYKLTQ